MHEMIMSVRGDMEATMALFIAVAMGVLGRIAHSGCVAPWREQLTSAMPVASLASLRQHCVRDRVFGFVPLAGVYDVV